jgi:DNA-binding transcriptional LysR family regulator
MNRSPRTDRSPSAFHLHDEGGKYRSRPHDVHNLYVSLKQWRLLHAVVDCGGYAEAAKALHLSQSTISYTISKLQEQLGVSLLRIEGRKAILTTAGRALLERSRHILKEAIELETFAKNLGHGWGEEVQVVFDHNFPAHSLMQAVNKFTVLGRGAANVHLREVAMLQVEEILKDHRVDLAISDRVPLGFLGEPLLEVEFIAVAHPEHPLLKLDREITAGDFAQHIQIEVGRMNHSGDSRIENRQQSRRWAMSSFDTVVTALCEGHGYAWLPAHRIRNWLDQGSLVRLPMRDKTVRNAILYLVHAHPWSATTAANRFAEVLREVIAEGVHARRVVPMEESTVAVRSAG